MHSYFCLFCLLSPHVVTLWRSGAYWLGVDEVGVGKEEEDLSCLLGMTILFPFWTSAVWNKTLPLAKEPGLR